MVNLHDVFKKKLLRANHTLYLNILLSKIIMGKLQLEAEYAEVKPRLNKTNFCDKRLYLKNVTGVHSIIMFTLRDEGRVHPNANLC